MKAEIHMFTIEEHEAAPVPGIVLGGDATHVVVAVPTAPEPEPQKKGKKGDD